MPLSTRSSGFAILLSAIALTGCGLDDVQLDGKIFDAMGVSGATKKSKEPKLAERQSLVMPPVAENLPEPGSGSAGQPELAEVKDPDRANSASRAELERQQAEFCKKNYELPKAHGDDSVSSVVGPLGDCRPSVLTAIKNINGSADE